MHSGKCISVTYCMLCVHSVCEHFIDTLLNTLSDVVYPSATRCVIIFVFIFFFFVGGGFLIIWYVSRSVGSAATVGSRLDSVVSPV